MTIVSGTASRVLVVDDEPMVREVVGRYLAREGFVVAEAADGPAAVTAVDDFRPDLVVLDVMLPGRSGFDVLRTLQARGDAAPPVILLTARVEEADRVLGLELGADDYVVKPFSPRELVARVRTVLRRARRAPESGDALVFEGLRIDPRTREITLADAVVEVTPKEFDLLAFLARSPRQVFTRAQLLQHVWDSSPDYQDAATVTVHVRRIRNKIERNPDEPRWITTVWGVGYRFEP